MHVHVWQGKVFQVEGKAIRYRERGCEHLPQIQVFLRLQQECFLASFAVMCSLWPCNQSRCGQYVHQCESMVPREEGEHLTHLTRILRAEILDISGLFCQWLPVPNTVMTCAQQEKWRLHFRNWASSPIIEGSCFSVKETVPCKREVIVCSGWASVCVVLSIS